MEAASRPDRWGVGELFSFLPQHSSGLCYEVLSVMCIMASAIRHQRGCHEQPWSPPTRTLASTRVPSATLVSAGLLWCIWPIAIRHQRGRHEQPWSPPARNSRRQAPPRWLLRGPPLQPCLDSRREECGRCRGGCNTHARGRGGGIDFIQAWPPKRQSRGAADLWRCVHRLSSPG